MAISKVSICNMALGHLGSKRIASLTDATEQAILCNIHYEQVVDEVLSEADWGCVTWRQTLAQVASTDDNYLIDDDNAEWDYQYSLPTNPYCLRVIDVPGLPAAEYHIESRYILYNDDELTIRYVKRELDPTKYDAPLTKAIVYKLAAELALALSGKSGLHGDMLVLYDRQLRRAANMDAKANQNKQPDYEDDGGSWTSVGRG
jgi:hypothetical protein